MRQAIVNRNENFAGILTEEDNGHFTFRYDDAYFLNDDLPSISLTLTKKQQTYKSDYLFPFFFNMLSEGANKKLQCRNKKLQCRHYQIDERDSFGLLLAIAQYDTIGAVTVKPISA